MMAPCTPWIKDRSVFTVNHKPHSIEFVGQLPGIPPMVAIHIDIDKVEIAHLAIHKFKGFEKIAGNDIFTFVNKPTTVKPIPSANGIAVTISRKNLFLVPMSFGVDFGSIDMYTESRIITAALL